MHGRIPVTDPDNDGEYKTLHETLKKIPFGAAAPARAYKKCFSVAVGNMENEGWHIPPATCTPSEGDLHKAFDSEASLPRTVIIEEVPVLAIHCQRAIQIASKTIRCKNRQVWKTLESAIWRP